MANPFRRFPFFYGRTPERLSTPYGPTLDLRKFVKLEVGQNAKLIADGFWEAPAAGGGVTGTLSVTLGAALLSGVGTVGVAGSGTPTLGALTGVGTGGVAVSGSGAQQLAALTASGSGSVSVGGSGSATLATLLAAGTGSVSLSGSLAVALDSLVCSGIGTVETTEEETQPGQVFGPMFYGAAPAGCCSRIKGRWWWKVV